MAREVAGDIADDTAAADNDLAGSDPAIDDIADFDFAHAVVGSYIGLVDIDQVPGIAGIFGADIDRDEPQVEHTLAPGQAAKTPVAG
jgi:hypothetical protein